MGSDLMVVEHTNDPISCRREEIQKIAEEADHEYYMSAGGPQLGHQDRAQRGRKRLVKYISDLEKLRETATCPACQQEIDRQIELQQKGLREIDHMWGNSLTTE
jgi:hypothetical protein